MNKYYDMNTAAEEAGKDSMPTPREMFNKIQGLQHDFDMLLIRYTRKCKERDDIKRTLDQTIVKLDDETARADALQRRCDDLEKSRQAWVMKCEVLTGRAEDLKQSNEDLQDLSRDYLQYYSDLRDHPWKNLLRPLMEVLGFA